MVPDDDAVPPCGRRVTIRYRQASPSCSLRIFLFLSLDNEYCCGARSVAAIVSSVAGDLNSPLPDVRDVAPESVRSDISTAFAAVLARGLLKRPQGRYRSLDEMATDLYGCLVQVLTYFPCGRGGLGGSHLAYIIPWGGNISRRELLIVACLVRACCLLLSLKSFITIFNDIFAVL